MSAAPGSTPAGDRLADRYGGPVSPGRRRTRLAVGAVAALVALGWVVWAGLGQAGADVRTNDVGFAIVSDQQVDVTYDVGKDPGRTAVCTLQALDRGKGTVGVAEVETGPTRERVTRVTAPVRTSALAVTGIVRACVLRP